MQSKTLGHFYAEHEGKVSDKWSLYLEEYEHIFSSYRSKSIKMLEIGVQNGGSLEIWLKYFPNCVKLIGCDINPRCGELVYADKRIAVVIGDANTDEIESEIIDQSSTFDIIIDDGSHFSSDIVKSFARYFPALNNGGIYVVEDIHSSYWKETEGGLFHPFSSIAFFKHMVDVVNYEHWGVDKKQTTLLKGTFAEYNIELVDAILEQVHSVEFVNSMCLIRKMSPQNNVAGCRVFGGIESDTHPVEPGVHYAGILFPQSHNNWSTSDIPPNEELPLRLQEVAQLKSKNNDLQADFQRQFNDFTHSMSWRITKPLRFLYRAWSLFTTLLFNTRRLFWLLIKWARGDLGSIEFQVLLLQSAIGAEKNQHNSSNQQTSSLEYKGALLVIGTRLIIMKKWWLFRLLFRKQSKYISYDHWCKLESERLLTEVPELIQHIDIMIHTPTFSVIVDAACSNENLSETLRSLEEQIYTRFNIFLLSGNRIAIPSSLKQKTTIIKDVSQLESPGDFVVFLHGGQSITKNALYEFANTLNREPFLDLIYADQDYKNSYGERSNPFYKPDWSPDYLETFNYIGFCACYRSSIAISLFNSLGLYDFVLRFSELTTKIFHVHKVLGHLSIGQESDTNIQEDVKENTSALMGRIKRTGRCGAVTEHPVHRGCFNIELDIKNHPLVSIIIPTSGTIVYEDNKEIDLIVNITNQIRNKSSYKNIEIVVVNNGRNLTESQTRDLEVAKCKLLTYADPVTNIPKKLNLGATVAKGELLLFLNDDIEILSPNWIERMVEHFEKPHVGVVGAKLLYSDGTIQQTSIAHKHGNPYHVRRCSPRNDPGYYYSSCGVRNFLGVSMLMMMTRNSVFSKVEGFCEVLDVNFSNTDYCLKVRNLGLWSMCSPIVEATCLNPMAPNSSPISIDTEIYQKKWASFSNTDPLYSNSSFILNANKR